MNEKTEFNNAVVKNIKKFNSLVREFTDIGMPKIDFSMGTPEEKQECVKQLEDGVERLQKSIEVIKGS